MYTSCQLSRDIQGNFQTERIIQCFLSYIKQTYNTDEKTSNQMYKITPSEIDKLIEEYYSPYVRDLVKELSTSKLVCRPATMDKVPVQSSFSVGVTYQFVP